MGLEANCKKHVLGDSSYNSSSNAEIVNKTFGEFLQDVEIGCVMCAFLSQFSSYMFCAFWVEFHKDISRVLVLKNFRWIILRERKHEMDMPIVCKASLQAFKFCVLPLWYVLEASCKMHLWWWQDSRVIICVCCLLSVANVWRDLWRRIQTYYRLVGLREHLEHVVSMFPSQLEFR